MTPKTAARIGAVAVIAVAVVAFRTLPVGEWLQSIEAWARANPVPGALAYIGLSVAAIVALAPGWIPMMLGGLVFGLWPGALYAMVGTVCGAAAAQIAGRTLARDWVARRIEGNPRLAAIDDALDEQALTIVTLTRLAFVVPFNLLNYAYGVTRVRTATYVAGTAVGMLPIVLLYAYLGSVARDIGDVLGGDAQVGEHGWWLGGIAVVAIIAVIVIVKRTVGRALDARMRESADT
ncbi:MAG: TVP38/TMEM64 family protein [Woeseiaceae bacterium]|nr:TVP38/TMEM64 family protein [Woeseiaceae bacterium]